MGRFLLAPLAALLLAAVLVAGCGSEDGGGDEGPSQAKLDRLSAQVPP